MRRIFATLLLIVFACLAAEGQNSTPQPSSTPPNSGDSSSKQTQPASPLPEPTPDQSATPDSSSQKHSVVKRKLEDLVPGCVNLGVYHKCKSSSETSDSNPPAKATPDAEFANDMDVGDFYFQRKNYAGAVLRFKDALQQKPNDLVATFRLAQSLEALHQADDAREDYAAYLKLEPSGRYAGKAKKALKRLQATSADKTK
jgi:tetratricopeptide (TPR) repeat protein